MDNRVEQVYELPGGWEKKIVPRKSGASVGRWDTYLIAPDGTKIRSNQDLIKYCAGTGTQIDPLVINMDKSCVEDKPADGSRMKPNKSVIQLSEALRRISNCGQSLHYDNSFRGFTAPAVVASSSSTTEYYGEADEMLVRSLPTHEFTARQVEYLERQYAKLDTFPTLNVFKFLARQLKMDQQHIEAWFKEKNRADGDWKIDCDYLDHERPVKKHCILDEHGFANMDVGDGSEMVECEIDPCDIVIEVDEED